MNTRKFMLGHAEYVILLLTFLKYKAINWFSQKVRSRSDILWVLPIYLSITMSQLRHLKKECFDVNT